MRGFSRALLVVTALTNLLGPIEVLAQTVPAGIVTAVHGTATIARASNNQAGPLRFKDDVFLHDRVTTGERSLARILLGGKAVVTARERSILTITAVPGAATLDLESGRLLLAVSKGAMRPGESIDIKTRNAIIGIRGTVVIADFAPGAARDGSGDATVFTILRGTVEVTQIDPLAARSVSAPLRLGALQSVKVMGTRFPEVTTISPEQAKRMTQGFAVPIHLTPETNKPVADMHAATIERELIGLLAPPQTSGSGTSTSRPSRATSQDGRSPGSTATANSGTLTGTPAGGTGPVSTVTGTVSGVTGAVTGTVSGVTGALTGTVSGVTGALTGTVSGVTGALTGPTGALAPTPAPTPTATSNPTPSQGNGGGLLGGLLKTTGSLLK